VRVIDCMAKAQHKVPKSDIGFALRAARTWRGLAQESFDLVSGRTYISAIERGLKDPTVGKINQLAEVLEIHPLTLLSLAYIDPAASPVVSAETLVDQLRLELLAIRTG